MFSSLTGLNAPDIIGKYLLLTSGTNISEWRFASGFTDSSGTVTVPRAYTGQVAGSVTAELHEFRPDWYTQAIIQAIREVYPHVYRPILSYIVPGFGSGSAEGGGGNSYRVPRNMRDVLRVLIGGDLKIRDLFDRADSTTDPGAGWTEATGNFGVISERFYSVDDGNGDLAIRAESLPNGMIQCIVRGTLLSGTVYRIPSIVFRCMEDRTGAIPAAASRSYLVARLNASNVELRNVDVGSEDALVQISTTTSDGTDYVLRTAFQGRTVRVWVDDVLLIAYELIGLNEKYINYGRFGVRWDLSGAPATAARFDDYQAWSLDSLHELGDWEQAADRITLRSPGHGRVGPSSSSILQIEGRAMLTAPTDDTTFETLDTDTTDRMEIQLTEPAWGLLLNYAAYCLYEQARQPGNTLTEAKAKQYAAESESFLNKYKRLLAEHGTPKPVVYRRSLF